MISEAGTLDLDFEGWVAPLVARSRICGDADEGESVVDGEGVSGFWIRKMLPCWEAWVDERRVVNCVRNCVC